AHSKEDSVSSSSHINVYLRDQTVGIYVSLFVIFKTNPRYILFIHLVLNDMILLTVTVSLFLLAYIFNTIYVLFCALLIVPAVLTTQNTPLNLLFMAVECYISVCIPLRYSQLCTVKRTYAVIVFRSSYSVNKRDASHIVFLVIVWLALYYTFFRILFVAKTADANANKATNTILLHGFQVLLCMIVYVQPKFTQFLLFLFPGQARLIYFAVFVISQILPRFSNPIVYGLRDATFRKYFKRYLSLHFPVLTSDQNQKQNHYQPSTVAHTRNLMQ
uniref:G-protein coupled receptors family 1 profile domain-containing protein n=1 Tax=Salarias fasciatus TaxID=181472 RepID=A0A672F999_SALFA